MRTFEQLDIGKDFLKQDHFRWFMLNLSGYANRFGGRYANLGAWRDLKM